MNDVQKAATIYGLDLQDLADFLDEIIDKHSLEVTTAGAPGTRTAPPSITWLSATVRP